VEETYGTKVRAHADLSTDIITLHEDLLLIPEIFALSADVIVIFNH
jgi:hypothetical protein